MATCRKSASALATTLVGLYELEFGGKQNGRYRISRKFLHEVAGRRKISDEFLRDVAEEMFEAGFILVDLGTYAAVMNRSLTSNYRHVTKNAVAEVLKFRVDGEDKKPRRTKPVSATKRKIAGRKNLDAEGG